MRFINDDVQLRHCSQYAQKTSTNDLRDIMKEAATRKDHELKEKLTLIDNWDESEYRYDVIANLMAKYVYADNDFRIGLNDCYIENNNEYLADDKGLDIGSPLMGFQTLENGFSFFGFLGGNEYDNNVFMIIYYYKKKLRCYVPSYGNIINLDGKCPIGSEELLGLESTKKYKKLIEEIKNSNIKYEDWELDEYNLCSTAYLYQYGLRINTVGFNWHAIKSDIMKTIYVEG